MCPLRSNQVIFTLTIIIIHCSIYLGEEIFDNINNGEMTGNSTGRNYNKMVGKVVGGEYATIVDYPHAVYLTAYCNERDANQFWTCGSSVLTQRLLLSAGHCVEGCKNRFKINALAGHSNIEKSKVLRQVSRYVLHSEYDPDTVFADISLLFLSKNLPLGPYIQRVIIRPSFPINALAKLAGWGATDERKKTTTNKLKSVNQKVWAPLECSKYERMQRGTICASSGSKHDYPFSGDSGSALITPDKQAIGLVSYRDDAKPELVIYTNVSYYYAWIIRHSKTLYCNTKHHLV